MHETDFDLLPPSGSSLLTYTQFFRQLTTYNQRNFYFGWLSQEMGDRVKAQLQLEGNWEKAF